jgi:hypothetical protein
MTGFAQTTNWAHRIVSKNSHPLTYWISHGGDVVNVLIIDGKRFEHVRGLNTFYLQVPKTNSIVFVTNEKDYSITYHIFNMDTDNDIAIHSQSSMSAFGNEIGSPYTNASDTVTMGDDGIIVLCNLDKGAKSTLASLADLDSIKQFIYLDPNKKAILADKTIYYDKSGKVIHEVDATPPF